MISSYHRIPRDTLGPSPTDSESFCYGANFGDEHVRLFPGAEVAASRWLPPMDDRWKPGFGPSPVGAWYLLREDGASSRYSDGLAIGSGEPGADFSDALPVKPS
jgi:hypothetical protein